MAFDLGEFGIFDSKDNITPELAAHIEELGFGTVWIGSSPAGDLGLIEQILKATETIKVATGVINIWSDDATTVGDSFNRLEDLYPGRFLLGLGVGHREADGSYERPLTALNNYLDVLDAAGVPADRRVTAALGPKMLELARERAGGAHPYLVPPAHTLLARRALGAGKLLAPVQNVVLEADPDKARAIGRPPVADPYLALGNYVANLARVGFTPEDLAGEGSDRLIDGLVAYGDNAAVERRLGEHHAAGADHVAIRLLPLPGSDLLTGYRDLARHLYGGSA